MSSSAPLVLPRGEPAGPVLTIIIIYYAITIVSINTVPRCGHGLLFSVYCFRLSQNIQKHMSKKTAATITTLPPPPSSLPAPGA